jgi:LPS export ABC transporter protein LptC
MKQVNILNTITLFYMLLSVSCVNDVAEVERITYTDKSPAQILKNATIEYSDSGFVKSVLKAPVIEKYADAGERTVFPKGVEVFFYNKNHEPESKITADFGELSENMKRLELKNNIVIISFTRKDTMYTEYLKQVPKHKDSLFNVSTNKLVVVRGNSGNFDCQGIRANDNFSRYVFGKSKGVFNYNEKEENGENEPLP